MAGKTMIPYWLSPRGAEREKRHYSGANPGAVRRRIRPGLIEHTHHDMDVDKPGKDSYELRKAGAAQTLVASQQRWALMN